MVSTSPINHNTKAASPNNTITHPIIPKIRFATSIFSPLLFLIPSLDTDLYKDNQNKTIEYNKLILINLW